jgi:hypothetical protein
MFWGKTLAIKSVFCLILCSFLFVVTATGCRQGDPKLVQVEGNVTAGNKPLTFGTVILYPDATKKNESKEEPRGSIDANGHYQVLTGVKEGVTPGWYRVSVSAAKLLDPKNPYHTDWLIPEKYLDPNKSKLRLEVVPNPAPGAYDLKLDPIK